MITFVGSLDTKVAFPFMSEYQARWSKWNRFTALVTRSFLRDGFLYITSTDQFIEKLTVHGVFEDATLGGLDDLVTGDPAPMFNVCKEGEDICRAPAGALQISSCREN